MYILNHVICECVSVTLHCLCYCCEAPVVCMGASKLKDNILNLTQADSWLECMLLMSLLILQAFSELHFSRSVMFIAPNVSDSIVELWHFTTW